MVASSFCITFDIHSSSSSGSTAEYLPIFYRVGVTVVALAALWGGVRPDVVGEAAALVISGGGRRAP